MNATEAARSARDVVFGEIAREGIGLLTTVDLEGRPHATWMGTMAATCDRQLVTLTSPDSRKVRNIRENPLVEWLFCDGDKSRLVYLTGEASLVASAGKIRTYWELMKRKDRAFFLDYFNSGIGFSIIHTQVESVRLVLPRKNMRFEIDENLFWNVEEAEADVVAGQTK